MVFQLISNGLMIPMTASATDNVVPEQTAEEKAKAEKAEQEAIKKATDWVNELFTDTDKTNIKSTVNEYTFNAYSAYTDNITDEDSKKALQQDVDLAQAFVAVNKLFADDDKFADNITKADVQSAKTTVQVYNLADSKGKAIIEKRLALAAKLTASLPENTEEATLSKEETSGEEKSSDAKSTEAQSDREAKTAEDAKTAAMADAPVKSSVKAKTKSVAKALDVESPATDLK